MSAYRIVRHRIFEYQYKHLGQNSPLKRQVDKQLEVIDSDPSNAGAALQGLPPDLAGKVKKLWVGGRKGHRLFIKTDHDKKVITILFVTPEKRGQLDYRKLTRDLIELLDVEVDEKSLKKFIVK